MFSSYDEYDKKIMVYLNGDFLTQPVEVKQPKRMKDIRRAVVDQFNFHGSREFRLFNDKGVELFEEDLEYLESDQCLYASKGPEFDTNSCLSEYDLVKVLGEGGFGKVMLGVHKKTKEKVAIKILHTSTISNAGEMDQIFREAEIMQSLEHHNIVKIKKCLTIRSQVVFIMEYMEGGELLERVEKADKFSEQEAQTYFKQMVSAISYCHQNKLIHRDLKLENILCTSEQEKVCKVADFGIAGVATPQNVENIDAGSLRYMAPEVLSGKLKTPSTAVDVWALGVILYSMLVGDLPFHGKDTREIINSICEGKYEIPKDIKKDLSQEVIDVMDKCLEVDHTKRIRSGQLLQLNWLKDKTIENILKKQQQQKEEIKEENEEEDDDEIIAYTQKKKSSEHIPKPGKSTMKPNSSNPRVSTKYLSQPAKLPLNKASPSTSKKTSILSQGSNNSTNGGAASEPKGSSSGNIPRYLQGTKSSQHSSKAKTPGGTQSKKQTSGPILTPGGGGTNTKSFSYTSKQASNKH